MHESRPTDLKDRMCDNWSLLTRDNVTLLIRDTSLTTIALNRNTPNSKKLKKKGEGGGTRSKIPPGRLEEIEHGPRPPKIIWMFTYSLNKGRRWRLRLDEDVQDWRFSVYVIWPAHFFAVPFVVNGEFSQNIMPHESSLFWLATYQFLNRLRSKWQLQKTSATKSCITKALFISMYSCIS